MMASARREKGKKTWEVVWDEPRDPETGKRRQRSKRGFPTKRAALQWYDRFEQQQARISGQSSVAAMPLSEYLADWLANHPVRDSTLYGYERVHRADINPYLGHIPVGDLTPQHIREWHQHLLDRNLSPATIRMNQTILSLALNHAVKSGDIERNPCRLVRPPRVEERERVVWNAEQIKAFLAVADTDRLGLLYRLLLFSQMRPGEALGLRWPDIDWERETATVGRTRTRNRRGRHIVGREPKTRSSSRSIPLSDDLMNRLRLHQSRQADERELAADQWQDDDLVFTRGDGRMLADGMVNYRLTKLAALAGVPRLTPHELRRSGATLLLDMGEELLVISRRLGHKSIATTADVYLRVTEQRQRDVSSRLDAILGSGNLAGDSGASED